MDRPTWVPDDIDLDRPSAARVYDYYLGGSHNFAVDRAMARQVMQLIPEVPAIARANRAFLRRAVRYVANQGIDQFLDIGSGIPTLGSVHEVARQTVPAARVAYVDIDPVAVAHSRSILADQRNAAVLQADLRDPQRILGDPQLRQVLDLDRPVALLIVSMLHFIPDEDDPAGIVGQYAEALAPGSYLVMSHAGTDNPPEPPAAGTSTLDLYARSGAPVTVRSIPEVTALFNGFELVEPGVVSVATWHPEELDDDIKERIQLLPFYAGVGRKVGR